MATTVMVAATAMATAAQEQHKLFTSKALAAASTLMAGQTYFTLATQKMRILKHVMYGILYIQAKSLMQ
jgi:hypothetical protein